MERYRTTLLLGAALLILGGIAFFLNNRTADSPGDTTPTPQTYIWEEANPVTALEVVSGSSRVVITKDVALGNWQIREPVDRPADIFQVGGVADSLQKLQAQHTLSETTDIAQYGLGGAPMQVSVAFSDTQGTRRTLLVGDASPDGGAYYVKLPDSNRVYTVANFTIEPLRTWLTTPPVQPPTPTPVPITPVTSTPTPPVTPSATASPGSAPPAADSAPTATATPAP